MLICGTSTTADLLDAVNDNTAKTTNSIEGLKASPGTAGGQSRDVTGGGRSGTFKWAQGDQSANVAADPSEGVYVAPTSDPSGAGGAWVRETGDHLTIEMFGGVANSAESQQPAYDAARSMAKRLGKDIRFFKGEYTLEKITIAYGTRHIGAGRQRTFLKAAEVADQGNYGFVECEVGRIVNSDVLSLSLVGNPANVEQWAFYLVASTGGAWPLDGGVWFTNFDVETSNFKNSVWLRGGVSGSNIPHQFINISGCKFRRLAGGTHYKCTGQVNQVIGENTLFESNPFTDQTGVGMFFGRDPDATASDNRRPQGHVYTVASIQSSRVAIEFAGCDGIIFEKPYIETCTRGVYAHGDTLNRGNYGVDVKNARFAEVGRESSRNITGISQGSPAVVTYEGDPVGEGEPVLIDGVGGMVEVNGARFRARNVTSTTFQLYKSDGVFPINSIGYTAYTSGGTATDGYLVLNEGFSNIEITSPFYIGSDPATSFADWSPSDWGMVVSGMKSRRTESAALTGMSIGLTKIVNMFSSVNLGQLRSLTARTTGGNTLNNVTSAVNVGETIRMIVEQGDSGNRIDFTEAGNLIIPGAATVATAYPGDLVELTQIQQGETAALRYIVNVVSLS